MCVTAGPGGLPLPFPRCHGRPRRLSRVKQTEMASRGGAVLPGLEAPVSMGDLEGGRPTHEFVTSVEGRPGPGPEPATPTVEVPLGVTQAPGYRPVPVRATPPSGVVVVGRRPTRRGDGVVERACPGTETVALPESTRGSPAPCSSLGYPRMCLVSREGRDGSDTPSHQFPCLTSVCRIRHGAHLL